MIRVTVELIPARNPKAIELMGTAIIANDGEGTPTSGNYTVTLFQRGFPGIVWRRGRVRDFPRKRLLAWDLLYRALKEIVAERNP